MERTAELVYHHPAATIRKGGVRPGGARHAEMEEPMPHTTPNRPERLPE